MVPAEVISFLINVIDEVKLHPFASEAITSISAELGNVVEE